jgi:protein-S-isoprenylcysteine O-methyltransferase Ste14
VAKPSRAEVQPDRVPDSDAEWIELQTEVKRLDQRALEQEAEARFEWTRRVAQLGVPIGTVAGFLVLNIAPANVGLHWWRMLAVLLCSVAIGVCATHAFAGLCWTAGYRPKRPPGW